jgi:hypothetical protein
VSQFAPSQEDVAALRAEMNHLLEERDKYREGWLARGRRINGVGEFQSEGPWEPVRKVQNRMLCGVVEALEDGYHPQNPSPLHPADFIRQRYPHLLREDDADASSQEDER